MDNVEKEIPQHLRESLEDVQQWAEQYAFSGTDGYIKEPNQVQKYINGEVPFFKAHLDLSKLGMSKICQGLLAAKSGKIAEAKTDILHGITRRLVFKGHYIISFKETGRFVFFPLDDVLMEMMAAISLGGFRITRQIHTILMQALTDGYSIRNGHQYEGQYTLRYSAMALTIIHEWLGQPLDLDKLGLPRDPAWGPLVSHWRDTDAEKILPVLNAACDVHVERIWDGQEGTEGLHEFNSPFLAVYPAEIVAVLRLRESLGLANPVIEHPLMQAPYAKITALPGEITQNDTLLDNYLNAARQRDPQIMQQWDAAECK